MLEYIVSKYNFWAYVILLLIGLYAMVGKKNLVKKLIGMNIFQSAVILFTFHRRKEGRSNGTNILRGCSCGSRSWTCSYRCCQLY